MSRKSKFNFSFKQVKTRIGESFKRKPIIKAISFHNNDNFAINISDGTACSSVSHLEDLQLKDGNGVLVKQLNTRMKNDLDVDETVIKIDDIRLSTDVDKSGINLAKQISEIKNESLGVGNLNEVDANFGYKYGDNFLSLSQTYVNDSNPRGFVFMQNFEIFDENTVPQRKGSDKDYKNLLSIFTDMGYECNEQNETCKSGRITAKEFHDNLTRFKELDEHKHVDSCLVVIMSHGCGDKKFTSSDGKEIRVKEICQALNNVHCKHLTDKPKILIFQFCRTPNIDIEMKTQNHDHKLSTLSFASYAGSMTSSIGHANGSGRALSMISNNSSVFSYETLANEPSRFINNHETENRRLSQINGREYDLDSSSILQEHRKLQLNSDFFLVFSTVGGEVSYRDPKSGSVLIKAICYVFKRHAHEDDIEELFRKVSLYLKSVGVHTETETLCTQTCERTNIGFDKKFYFVPINVFSSK